METACHPRLVEIRTYAPFEPGKGKELLGVGSRAECDVCGSGIYRGMVRCFCGREIIWDEPSAETVEVRERDDDAAKAFRRVSPYREIDASPDEWAEEKA